MNTFHRIINNVSIWTGKIFSFFFILAALSTSYAVIMRYFFQSPVVWGLELPIYLCGATYLMSGAFTEQQDAHIRIDPIYQKLSQTNRIMIDLLLTTPLLFFTCLFLIWSGGKWTWEAIVTMEHSMTLWNPVIWPVRILIPFGSLLLLLQGMSKSIQNIEKLRKIKREGQQV